MSESSSRYDQYKNTDVRDVKNNTYEVAHDIHKSYLKLRRAIGYCGILLPFILVFTSLINRNGCGVLPSISDYYHTSVGVIFTGMLIAIAIFLWYNSGDRGEKMICKFASVLALLIALAPTPLKKEFVINEQTNFKYSLFSSCYIPKTETLELVGKIHFSSATLFFIILSVLVGYKFKQNENHTDSQGRNRRRIYIICSLGMISGLIILAIFKIFFEESFPDSDSWDLPPTITIETIMLLFFGVAWLVKGEITFDSIKSIFEPDEK